jgi:hypothetical protein
MKKIITLIILLASLIGNAQCPTPSNVTIISYQLPEVTLGWTENGTANSWQVLVIPYYDIGTPIPTAGWIDATTNPITIVGVPQACNVFFVRSVCSAADVSPWAAVASSGCSANVYNYLETLSNDNFPINDDRYIKIFPNPSKSILQIKNTSKIDKITVFDSLGKVILTQSQNNNEINVEKLTKGIYLIEISTENEKFYRKFIKE